MRSNCLLEALKAKLIGPFNNKIYHKDSWLCVLKHRWPHFYWYHKPHDKYYHFAQDDALTWMQQLWYKGDISEYKGINRLEE